MIKILLIFGLFGILTSSVYLLLVAIAGLRFRRRRKSSERFTPPVCLLKPLQGAEPGLREYLEGFFKLDYPEYEILFCARKESDEGLAIARELAARYPHIPVRFLTSGASPWPNAKCYSLNEMKAASQHEILVITDSDVRVTPDYLRAVVGPFRDEKTGLVTRLYRGVAAKVGFCDPLDGVGMFWVIHAGMLVTDL